MPPDLVTRNAILTILPLVVALTALGGGYAVLRSRGATWRRISWIALGIFVTAIAAVQQPTASPGLIVLAGYALFRGFRMVQWGLHPGDDEVARARKTRLLLAGTTLGGIAVLWGGVGVAFWGWTINSNRAYAIESSLVQLVAAELHLAGEAERAGGERRFVAPTFPPSGDCLLGGARFPFLSGPDATRRNAYVTQLEMGPERRSFRIWVTPEGALPFAPYNRLISRPSYYADDSGKIRSVPVHEPGLRCPPNALVTREVGPGDMAAAAALLAAAAEEAEGPGDGKE